VPRKYRPPAWPDSNGTLTLSVPESAASTGCACGLPRKSGKPSMQTKWKARAGEPQVTAQHPFGVTWHPSTPCEAWPAFEPSPGSSLPVGRTPVSTPAGSDTGRRTGSYRKTWRSRSRALPQASPAPGSQLPAAPERKRWVLCSVLGSQGRG
jgi:hypothetical protein